MTVCVARSTTAFESKVGSCSISAPPGKLMTALVNEDIGELDSALRLLDESDELLRALGDSRGLVAVHMRRGVIREKMGEYSAAEKDYSQAAKHAELAGDKAAFELAMDNLTSLKKN